MDATSRIRQESHIGLAPDVIPEVRKPLQAQGSDTGVSTRSALAPAHASGRHEDHGGIRRWHVLRATYGRERAACEYLSAHGVEAFHPTRVVPRLARNREAVVRESLIPNLLFAFGAYDELKAHVYDNVHLPWLRFYCRDIGTGRDRRREPLVVPDEQMRNFRIICEAADSADVIITPETIRKFRVGQMVRVTAGDFKGIIGMVARWHGQQRVAVIIDGLLTACTAYIPSAYLEGVECAHCGNILPKDATYCHVHGAPPLNECCRKCL